nr:RNA-directed DNA polymerase, eukaryota, reverse transcriptase zinc-binding domain protein [Tanacetum cinerariifolium]
AFFNHFASRFQEPANFRFKLNFDFPKKLLQNKAEELESSVSHDEIRRAVWDCGDNKSPGPDGFTFEFFKKYWDFVGHDFCEAVDYFFVHGSFAKGCNSSFIALIPKVLHWCKRRKKQAMFFKVDFTKAYDSVRWDYLLDILEAFGFGQTWCKSVRGILNSAKASILVNGSPTKEFSCHHGLNKEIRVTVGQQSSRLSAWDDIIAKLRSRLSKWNVKTLSIGGRLTLLKSVLGASPIYNMSIFKVPRGALKIMKGIRCRFFNGMDQSDKKITWVACNKVLASQKHGGLRVSSFFALNRALLLKWIWRFISCDSSLWSKVIQALYGTSIDLHPTHYSSNWCSIVRELHQLKESGFDF